MPRVKIIHVKFGKNYRWKIPEQLAGQRLEIEIENLKDDNDYDFDFRFVDVKGIQKVVAKKVLSGLSINNKQVGYLTITTRHPDSKVKIKGYKYPLNLFV